MSQYKPLDGEIRNEARLRGAPHSYSHACRGLAGFFLAATTVYCEAVEHYCESGTGQRTYYHNPEVAPGVAGREDGGTETAGGVYGAVVYRDTGDVNETEAETDGETGELAEAEFLIGGTEDDEHEEHREQDLYDKSECGGSTGLEHVGGEGIFTGHTAESKFGSGVHTPEEEGGTYCGTEELSHNVAAEVLYRHLTGEEHGERYGGVHVATGYIADCVAETHEHEAEADTYTEAADHIAGKYRATAGEQHEEHRSEQFG